MRTLYLALIHTHFSYGIILWGNADQNAIRSAIMLQKRAIRVINNAPYNSHTDPKFRKSGILKIKDLYEYQSLLFIYDYFNQKLPSSFNGIFPTNRDMPNSRDTRQSNLLYMPRFTSKFAQKLPIYSLPYLWNNWSRLLPGNYSRSQIKHFIKNYMLQGYLEDVKCDNLRCVECHPN